MTWPPGYEALVFVLEGPVLDLGLTILSLTKTLYVAVHRIWADVLLYTASVTVARITMLVIGITVYL